MSLRLKHPTGPDSWNEITIEGPHLTCYEYWKDPDRPNCWIDGFHYHFGKKLLSVKRLDAKAVNAAFEGAR